MKKIKVLAVLLILSTFAFAQIETPAPSPSAKSEFVVGLTTVSVDYSRPSIKDRTIFGDLVPYGKMWRTGANATTKISFNTNVTLNGNDIAEGTYALFTIPGESKWTVILNSNTEKNVWEYDESAEVVRFDVTPTKLNDKVESMTIDLNNLRDESASLNLMWENTKVSIDVNVEVKSVVLAQIDEVMAGPTKSDYYRAARYYLENDQDIDKAEMWINKAIEGYGEKYWNMRQKALILAKKGDTKGAIAAAEKSLALAKEAEAEGYIKSNTASLKEWKK